MNARPPSKGVDAYDRTYYLVIAMTVFFFGLVVLGLVGEHLGWWNDVGEVLIAVGTAGGVVGAFVTVTMGSSRRQVRDVSNVVHDNNDVLVRIDGKLDRLDRLDKLDKLAMLDSLDQKLDRQTVVLTQIRDRL